MNRNVIKIIDEATALLWKTEVIENLKSKQEVPAPMEADLQQMLVPHYKPKGHFILDQFIKYHSHASFIRKGRAKLYKYDKKGRQHIMHIWSENEIMVYFRLFRKRIENTKYCIELLEDCELVSISNDDMDILYTRYPVSYELTLDVLEHKGLQKEHRIEILDSSGKLERPDLFNEMFPQLKNKLSNSDRKAFLGTGDSTLFRANHNSDKENEDAKSSNEG